MNKFRIERDGNKLTYYYLSDTVDYPSESLEFKNDVECITFLLDFMVKSPCKYLYIQYDLWGEMEYVFRKSKIKNSHHMMYVIKNNTLTLNL